MSLDEWQALRTSFKERDRDERQLIRTWLQEASREDLLYAWAEGVYTWRELARAVHAAGEQTSPRYADINTLIPS